MPIQLVTPASGLAISLDDAKANLRVSGNRMDAQLELWIRGVTRHAEGIMQRSLINKDWKLTLDAFRPSIKLRFPPVVTIAHVRYYDADNLLQTLDPSLYVTDGMRLAPAPNASWPAAARRLDAVEVQYTSGYGSAADALPEDIRLYLLAKLAEQFDPAARPEKDTVQATFIDHLLDDYVVYP